MDGLRCVPSLVSLLHLDSLDSTSIGPRTFLPSLRSLIVFWVLCVLVSLLPLKTALALVSPGHDVPARLSHRNSLSTIPEGAEMQKEEAKRKVCESKPVDTEL